MHSYDDPLVVLLDEDGADDDGMALALAIETFERLDRASLHFVEFCLDVLFFIGLGIFRLVRKGVSLELQFRQRRL